VSGVYAVAAAERRALVMTPSAGKDPRRPIQSLEKEKKKVRSGSPRGASYAAKERRTATLVPVTHRKSPSSSRPRN